MRFPGLAVALRRKTRQRLSYAMPSVGVPITTRASHAKTCARGCLLRTFGAGASLTVAAALLGQARGRRPGDVEKPFPRPFGTTLGGLRGITMQANPASRKPWLISDLRARIVLAWLVARWRQTVVKQIVEDMFG